MVMSSSQKNSRKISKQFLFLALFSSAHHVTIMTLKKKNSSAFTSQKMRITSQWFLHGVILLYCVKDKNIKKNFQHHDYKMS